jgi:hypothetical protein
MKPFTKLTGFLLALMISGLFAQCKKDKEDEIQLSKTDMLTSGQWRVIAHTSNLAFDWDLDGTSETDLYNAYEPCERDNYLVFKKDGSYERNEGATKCFSEDPQSDTGTWFFVENETKINIDGDVGIIEELTNTRMRLSVDMGFDDLVWTVTLGK